jgi:8-oxo-dGTP pyrophosphatase MutT (NUDIX family)
MFLNEDGLQNLNMDDLYLDPDYIRESINNNSHPEKPSTQDYRSASVFMLLDSERPTEIVAIQKADTEGYPWRNQVAFPGGHVDKTDPTQKDAAFRELREELCILPENVDYIGSIGHFMTIKNLLIEAFVGIWNGKDQIEFDKAEISRVIRIPLGNLLATHHEKGFSGRSPDWTELIYPYDDVEVWGVTAKIIHHFIEVVSSESAE